MSMKVNPLSKYSLKAIRRMNRIPPKNSSYVQRQSYNEPDFRTMIKALDKLSGTLRTIKIIIG